jgi:ABC-type Fe3+-hydroxamate transport system substrate-binding protein
VGQLVLRDDVGTWVNIPKRVTRIISLVPSLTEAISQTHLGSLVGVTEWCSYPPDLDVTRVRGTKNPDCKTIVGQRPDLVLAHTDENREIDVRRLRESGICVWVTDIKSIPQAFDSLDRIFEPVLRWGRPEWLLAARDAWSSPPPSLGACVAVPVWRDP